MSSNARLKLQRSQARKAAAFARSEEENRPGIHVQPQVLRRVCVYLPTLDVKPKLTAHRTVFLQACSRWPARRENVSCHLLQEAAVIVNIGKKASAFHFFEGL